MKINILTPHLKISGGVMVLATYAHHLSLLGHDVQAITDNPVAWRRIAANVFRQKPSWMRNLKFSLLRVPALDEKYLNEADILMVSSYRHANVVNNFSEKFGKKVYIAQHDERLYHGKPEEVAKAYRLPFNFIAVSTWISDWLKTDFNQDAELLINTLDKSIFYPRGSKRNDNDIRILMLHHTYEWKGTAEGVEIINDLKKKYPEIKLVMYGARQEDAVCDEYHYKPFGNETAEIFSGCDIFLCPSWDEGFGLPSLEAMACGCAVVTYDNGGSRDFAFDGRTALVAKRRDREDLKNILEKLLIDSSLRKKIAEAGAQFVKEMPSWEEQARQLETLMCK